MAKKKTATKWPVPIGKMIEPDFWEGKHGHGRYFISKEQIKEENKIKKDTEKWLLAEKQYIDKDKPKQKKGEPTMEQVLHHAKEKRGRPKKLSVKFSEEPKTKKIKAEVRVIEEPYRQGRTLPKKSTATAPEASDAPKKRGRPKGSKNKPKSVPEAPVKRGRGRPKGSKNKPKEV